MIKILRIVCILFIVQSFSYAEIYKWKDENGAIRFSDSRPNVEEFSVIEFEDESPKENEIETMKNETKIISWEATNEKSNSVKFAVKYFYDGQYGDEKMWISATTKANGSTTSYYSVRPGTIMPGEHIAIIDVGVASFAPKRYCSDQVQFSMYGRNISTFHKATVNYSKCWTNTYVKPTESIPTEGVD